MVERIGRGREVRQSMPVVREVVEEAGDVAHGVVGGESKSVSRGESGGYKETSDKL